MSTLQKIADYWMQHIDECGFPVDRAEAHEHCWRCACKRKLEKHHIIPKSLGGSDGPENLVLLCLQCHRNAPNVNNPQILWDWIREAREPFKRELPEMPFSGHYDSYWYLCAFREFKNKHSRLPFFKETITPRPERGDVERLLGSMVEKCSMHFGENGLSLSTWVYLFEQIELLWEQEQE